MGKMSPEARARLYALKIAGMGANAYNTGKPSTDCPTSLSVHDANTWRIGWENAKRSNEALIENMEWEQERDRLQEEQEGKEQW